MLMNFSDMLIEICGCACGYWFFIKAISRRLIAHNQQLHHDTHGNENRKQTITTIEKISVLSHDCRSQHDR